MSKSKRKSDKAQTVKELSSVKILYIVISLVIVGMIILYTSDTFYSIPAAGAVSTGNLNNNAQADPHSGVDLNQLNRIKDLEKEASNSNNPEIILELGHLYNDSGFFDKAIETYKKYLVNNPKSPDVLVDMGVCYFNLKNYDEAKKVMKRALNINANHQIAKFNLGIVTYASGGIQEAKDWWQKAIDTDPSSEIARKAKNLLETN